MLPSPAAPTGGNDQQQIERQLIQLLRRAKQMAEANGVNFSAIVSQVEGSMEGVTPTTPPMPPSGLA